MTDPTRPSGAPVVDPIASAGEPDPKRWLALAVLAAAQLMIVLDASIVNIALPSAQADLEISNACAECCALHLQCLVLSKELLALAYEIST